jgi:protease I
VIPGGRAPEYVRNDPDLPRIIQHFFAENKPVDQICHAPLALAAAGVVGGHRSTPYPALAADVRAGGGESVDSEAVVDGRMVSAQAWPDHRAWMREFMALLRQHAPVVDQSQPVEA